MSILLTTTLFYLSIYGIQANMRSAKMSILSGKRYECLNNSCYSLMNLTVSNIRRCQIACFISDNCSISTFNQVTRECQLFSSSPSSNITWTEDFNLTTMFIFSDERNPMGMFIERHKENRRVYARLSQ